MNKQDRSKPERSKASSRRQNVGAEAPETELPPQEAIRWRLILGKSAEEVTAGMGLGVDGASPSQLRERSDLDQALTFVYGAIQERRGDLGAAAVYLPEWLDQVREFFKTETATLLIKDALERRGLTQLLVQPELIDSLEPDPALAATLLALRDQVPDGAKVAVRALIRKVVEKIERNLRTGLTTAVKRGRRLSSRHGNFRSLDWSRTIEGNLKHYIPERKALAAEQFYFRRTVTPGVDWILILLVDQSGSMAESVVHAAVAAGILSGVRTVRTHLLFFGTEVTDMTEIARDPVEVLTSAQIGGGTNICGAVAVATRRIENPQKTILAIVTDLYEGGSEEGLKQQLAALNESGCRTVCLLSLSGDGRLDANTRLAAELSALGTPSFSTRDGDIIDLAAKLWSPAWPPVGN